MNTPQQPNRHSPWKIWGNPIFLRYCRSRLRPRGFGVALLISVLIAGFVFFMVRFGMRYRTDMSLADVERAALIPLFFLQGLILFILGTAQVAGGMTAEADEGVLDYQRLIPMSPLAKVFGYLFGLPVREYAMVLSTLPFTAWALWRGEVSSHVWFPLYLAFFTSAITYHLTGMVTGMVVKNRRWAFLVSIGLVFCLYTVIPQMARFGLVFFKYLTITPVLMENMPKLIPETAGAIVATSQKFAPAVKFFNLDFSETVFTLFSQSGLILTFIVMLCRRWRRAESLLLGKLWAAGLFIWVQILLLGNALPTVEVGSIFPSQEFTRRFKFLQSQGPEGWEAVVMSGIYGLVTFLFLLILVKMITPTTELQIRGWRRAKKQGRSSLPVLSDAATAFGFVLIMAVAAAVGWFIFTRGVIESRWFPGQVVPLKVLGYFTLVMLTGGLGFHALLEARGGRVVGLAIIFIGVVPLMIGAILSVSSNRLLPAASWLFGLSPASAPVYAVGTLLELSELPAKVARSIPYAFYFWQAVFALTTLWLLVRLHAARKRIAESATVDGPQASPTLDVTEPFS